MTPTSPPSPDEPSTASDEGVDEFDAVEESDGAQHRRFILQRDIKRRLDRYLTARLPGLSRSRLQKLINEGAVTVNDQTPKSSTIVKQRDVVDVIVPPPAVKQIPAEPIPLDVLYEDEHLIVVNKQADLVVHPARSNLTGTLVNGLAWYFRHASANGLEALSRVGVDEFRPGIVHRLDKDTTGAIVIAKTDQAHWRLGHQFERRQVQKHYLALVHGQMTPPGDAIDQPIGKHPSVAEAYAVRNDGGGYARDAVTLYRVRQVFDGYTLVELELKTGRTHQIRVHLSWLGHPVVTDIIYGGEPVSPAQLLDPPAAAGSQPRLTYARQKADGVKIWDRMRDRADLLIRRPALHAAVLGFAHPVTGQWMNVTAPLHADMRALLGALVERSPDSRPLTADGARVNLDKVAAAG
ncbi:MAG: RluA family pseudouridine synthase [Planctomycetes bacterium]|jgi:23S rRNA pseudouridine1911/1915/1917 synthase|nr:RluA family pseudouridine synthase [Planctomycetota bacterium]